MFDFIRNHKKIMQILLIILIFPSFVLFGIDGYKRFNGKGEVVASVDGVDISREEWEKSHENEIARMRASMPTIDVSMFDTPAIKYGVLERLVQSKVLEASARKLNVKVSDQKVAQSIAEMEVLASIKKPDGSLDLEKYRQLLAAQGMTPEIFENRMRSDAAIKQVVTGVTQSSVTFPSQMEVALDAFYQQREVQIAIFSASDYLADAKPTDEEIEKYFNSHKEEFKSLESADIEYVVLSQETIEKTISVSEAELKSYFDQNQSNLAAKEERRASHILVNAPKEMNDADKAKAKEKALSLLESVKKSPAQFAEIAKKNSQDPGSAANGGDLGFFARGAMVKPFEEAAFSLKKGDISGLVQSDFGYHIIQLTDVKSASSANFVQMRSVLETELKKQLAQKKYAEIAEQFTNMVYEQADNFKGVAQKLKLDIQTASGVSKDINADKKTPWANPNVLKAIFSSESIKNLRNSEAMEIAPNTLISVRITKHNPANYLSLEEVKPMLVQTVLNEKALSLAKKDGAAKLALWKTSPDKAELQAAVALSRDQNSKLPGNLVDEAMRANPDKLPVMMGVDLGAKGYGIVKVNKMLASASNPTKTPELRQRFIKSWSTAENLAYFSYLKDILKVTLKEPPPNGAKQAK
ncbi:MAG: peptidyl-prolyl cis-trans isomerase [Betaproteobacteria bacterium]|jgi:peptidyl-prolyl cis-trans isomerase D|nr:peptidyl-prolyl cis-trans isomerase [Betaproteobacteria bacterium]